MTKSLGSDFTKGPIFKNLLLFTVPFFLSNLLQILYNVIDMIVVGQAAGQIGLSAVSIGGDITNCLTTVIIGFSTAGQVIISQYLGAGERQRIGPFIGTMSVFILVCALAFSAVCLILRDSLLVWMSTPKEGWREARDYVTVCLLGLIFLCGYNTVSAVLRGMGDGRHPLLFAVIASGINVALDLVFVIRFSWGAAGAAAATVIAQAVSFLLAVAFLRSRREQLGFVIRTCDFTIDREFALLLVKIGVPMALKSAAVQITKLFVDSFINSYGVVVCAACGVTNRISSIINLLSQAFNTSGSAMISQNIGGERYERVTQILARMFAVTIPMTAAACLALVCWPEEIFRLFTGEGEVIAVCMTYVPIGVAAFLSSAVRSPMNALIYGCGNYKINFVTAVLDGMILRVGLSLFFGLSAGMGYRGFWLGDAIAGYTPCVIGLVLFVSGKWKTNRYII